jgi:DNA segregation ATPase FtsK/SpoIIIE-like protein
MIIQMCHNTHPDDLQLRLLEPKNELQRFASLQHVTHLVDMQTPGESHYHNAADLLADTAAEMERRYATFDKHPAKPKKLSEARFIASTEGPLPNGQRHPLQMPYMVVIIEECADFFHTPSLRKQFGEAHEKVIYYVELLARKARATGIYLVIATQYPTNTNLPQTLKQMCRRVGLGTGDQNASRVIIDQNGLEDITVPGRGLFSYGKSYRGFRSLYLRAPDQAHPDLPNDLAEIMSAIPQRDSSGHVYFGAGGTPASNDPAPIPAGIWDT